MKDNLSKQISEGVEQKILFDDTTQRIIYKGIEDWFAVTKDKIPEVGIFIYSKFDDPKVYSKAQLPLPASIKQLLSAILADAIKDPENNTKPIVKIVLERTGDKYSHGHDFGYHIDTKQIYWDKNRNRVAYDPGKGPDKYMVFIDRPGSFIIEGKIATNISRAEAMKIASMYTVDSVTGKTIVSGTAPEPSVIQLNRNEIYKVAVGNVLHALPPHKDGLLITVSMIEEIPDAIKNIS